MNWVTLFMGGCGFLLALSRRPRVDLFVFFLFATARRQLHRLFSTPPTVDEDLQLTARMISCLRSGMSLDAAIESAAQAAEFTGTARLRLKLILEGSAGDDFLSQFLSSSLKTGAPVLSALQGIERALIAKRRLTLRAQAATGQCRAQAEVLSWLPWILALAIALIDADWFASAIRHSLSWLFWAIAVGLTGLGRQWMRHSLKSALSPKGKIETIEETVVPDLVLRLIGELSQGIDVESACEQSLRAMKNGELSQLYSSSEPQHTHRIARLKSLLTHSARTGAPVREELLGFLADLQTELEARWEERVQRLPVALLAPLFVCFFPSSLLVLSGLLFPLFTEVL